MKILLLGANGQLGRALRRTLADNADVVSATRTGTLEDGSRCEVADLLRADDVSATIRGIAPDVVVNAAAYTAVDAAESHAALAFKINAEAPRMIAEACRRQDALLIHYSTDYVFDGTATAPYSEEHATAPLNRYGESKLAGERAIRDVGGRFSILRSAWIYAAHGHNFLRTMLRLAKAGSPIRVVDDQIGTPTSADHIADTTARLIRASDDVTGTWHLTALGQASWYEFAEEIFERAQAMGLIDHRPRSTPISAREYPTAARRPTYSVLDCTRLQQALGMRFPAWKDDLRNVAARVDMREL